MKPIKSSHYDWLDKNLPTFFAKVGLDWRGNEGIISAHGDKCYTYREQWEKEGIPFEHGVAVYLLSYCRPFDKESRETINGWVPPVDWVIKAYHERFKVILTEV